MVAVVAPSFLERGGQGGFADRRRRPPSGGAEPPAASAAGATNATAR